MSELIHLEFLAAKSKEMVIRQTDSYQKNKTMASTIIGVSALFIPFFINGIEGAAIIIKYLSIVPIVMFVSVQISMLIVLMLRPRTTFVKAEKYDELISQSYEQILKYEISSNKHIFSQNKNMDAKVAKYYNVGVQITIVAIIISTILLLINSFYNTQLMIKETEKYSIHNMKDDEKTDKPKDLPIVQPTDFEKINESYDKSKVEQNRDTSKNKKDD